ncbi:MAG: hypothetical protein MK081_12610 [Flavobacteriales bacterium]|nr:hypothetical protein [Flavobacteriales bacterium]
MINYHLLTKISGYDSDFRKQILEMIANRFERANAEALRYVSERRWSANYLLLERYLHDLQPYTQPSFMQELNDNLSLIKEADSDEERDLRTKFLLNTIHNGLVQAQVFFDKNAMTSKDPNAVQAKGE